MRIRWQDRVLNQEVLERTSTTSIEAMIIKAQLRWTGYVIRMDESRIPRQLFYGELTEGKRNPGRPKRDTRITLKQTSNGQASNRRNWRPLQAMGLDGVQPPWALLETLRTTSVCASQQREIAEKGQQTTESQPEAPYLQSVIAYAPQSLVFKATCVRTADA